MQSVYPDLYRVDDLNDEGALHEEGGDSSDEDGNTEVIVPQPDRLQVFFKRSIIVFTLNCPIFVHHLKSERISPEF